MFDLLIHQYIQNTDDEDDDEDEDEVEAGIGQDAAKAAQAVMTAAAVMMASKQANKNKELLEKSVLSSAGKKSFKPSYQNGKRCGQYISISI